MESAPFVRVKMQSPAVSISLKEASSALMPSDGSDTKEPFTGSKGPGQTQGEASAVSGTVLESTSGRKHTKEAGAAQVVETADGSPESQLTKEPVQELNSDRQARSEVEHREQMPQHIVPVTSQGRAMSEPMKGKLIRFDFINGGFGCVFYHLSAMPKYSKQSTSTEFVVSIITRKYVYKPHHKQGKSKIYILEIWVFSF